jgi:hypothetical protein
MDEAVKVILREELETLRREQRLVLRKIEEIEGGVAAIARSLEQEDRLQERQERAEEREREKLIEAVDNLREYLRDDLQVRIEGIGTGLRNLPESILQLIEREIYKLRRARWDAGEPLPREPTPPFGTQLPPRNEPTGKIAVAAPEADELLLTPGQQRGLVKLVKTAWGHGKWHALAVGLGGTVVGFWHKIMALFGH